MSTVIYATTKQKWCWWWLLWWSWWRWWRRRRLRRRQQWIVNGNNDCDDNANKNEINATKRYIFNMNEVCAKTTAQNYHQVKWMDCEQQQPFPQPPSLNLLQVIICYEFQHNLLKLFCDNCFYLDKRSTHRCVLSYSYVNEHVFVSVKMMDVCLLGVQCEQNMHKYLHHDDFGSSEIINCYCWHHFKYSMRWHHII